MQRVLFLYTTALPTCACAPLEHLVVEMPGMVEQLRSKTYAGLMSVPARSYRHPWGDSGTSPAVDAFYWYSESERDPDEDPIILWLQGGPGGSSLFGGFVEMGPLKLDDRSFATTKYNTTGVPTPIRNDASWTTFAGLILLEYADIGFSNVISETSEQTAQKHTEHKRYEWNIGSATEAIVGFLAKFFERFPERQGRPVWIAGESFAGNLVSTVASALDAQGPGNGVKLAGVIHGNAAVGDYQGAESTMASIGDGGPPLDTNDMGPLDVQGHVDFWWRTGLTSTKLYQSVLKACPSLGQVKPDSTCKRLLKEMKSRIGNFEEMGKDAAWWNVYNIYDTCSDMPHLQARSQEHDAEHSATWICGGILAMQKYFNRADVQKAIHVNRTTKWVANDDDLRWHHPKEGISFLGEIKRLAVKYPFLAYSGDADAQIPHTTSEMWTSSLGFKELEPYQKWTLNKYVQGYVTRYEHNFTFATVKGAGHMVPLHRPAAAHTMVQRFLATHQLLAVGQLKDANSHIIV